MSLRARAQALIELALVAPFLILLAMGVWDGGGVLRDQAILEQAARDGARVAATGYDATVDSSVVCGAVVRSARDLPGLACDATNVQRNTGSVTVTLTYAHALFTPILRDLWRGGKATFPLQANAMFFLPQQTPVPATIVPSTFTPTPVPTATATPVPVANRLAFSVQPGNAAAGASLAPAVQVTVQDSSGNTVTSSSASVTLAIGANPGAGTLGGTLTVSAVNGVASFSTLSINRVGTGYTLTATSGVLTGATSSPFNIVAGAPSKLVFSVQPTNAAAGASITPAVQVTVQDASGNTVITSSAPITVGISNNAGGGTLGGTLTVNASSGVANFSTLSIDKTGVGYTLIASSGILSSATSTPFNITPGAANKLAFSVQPTNAAIGVSIAPAVQVTVQDSSGNTVTSSSASVTIAIGTNPGGGTLSGTPTVGASSGVASFGNLSINRVGTGYTLTASSAGLTGAISTTFNIVAGPAAKLGFSVQPTNAAAGSAVTPGVQVTIQDASGNTVTTSSAPITLALGANPGAGILSGTLTVNASGGVASFADLSINRPGIGYTLVASSAGLTSATSTTFNITVGAASKLAFSVQPSNAVAGASIAPAVQVIVQDASGNTVTSSSASITLAIGANPGAGTLGGTATVTASSGVASFNTLWIDKVGVGYTLIASSGGLGTATSTPFTITPGAASKLAFSVQPTNEQVSVSIAPAIQVTVEDSFGNTVTGSAASINVTISNNPGGGTLAGTTPVNASSGVATFANLSINRVGNGYTLRASASGGLNVTSTSFNITPVPTPTPTATPIPPTPTATPTVTPTPTSTPTVTNTPTPTVTPTPTITPTPGPNRPCVVAATQPIPLLDSGFGYWCTVQVTATSFVIANWQVNYDPNNQLLIYSGNPFAGLSDPVQRAPTTDIGTQFQFQGQLWSATSCVPPGTYSVYFYNVGSQFAASSGAVFVTPCQ